MEDDDDDEVLLGRRPKRRLPLPLSSELAPSNSCDRLWALSKLSSRSLDKWSWG